MKEKSGDAGTSRTVQAVDTTCRILFELKRTNGAGVTELSKRLGVSKATVHSHLATLNQNRLIVKDDGTYRLGLKFLDLGEFAKNQVPVLDQAKREMEEIVGEYEGMRVQFVVEEFGEAICVHLTRGDHSITPRTRTGEGSPLHATAAGKSILAFLPDHRVTEIVERRGLEPLTDETITERERLDEELDRIRERNVAFNDEEKIVGLRAVGAPIRTADGNVLGAISISGPTSELKGERFREEFPEVVTNAANRIEVNVQIENNRRG